MAQRDEVTCLKQIVTEIPLYFVLLRKEQNRMVTECSSHPRFLLLFSDTRNSLSLHKSLWLFEVDF